MVRLISVKKKNGKNKKATHKGQSQKHKES